MHASCEEPGTISGWAGKRGHHNTLAYNRQNQGYMWRIMDTLVNANAG